MATSGEHTSKRFDSELGDIKDGIIRMGGMVRDQFRSALGGMESGDVALLKQVYDLSYRAQVAEIEIDHKCNRVLAQRQPEAGDLRFILTAFRITKDLERIGTQSAAIAHRVEKLLNEHPINLPRFTDILHCARQTQDMLDNALESFVRSDAVIAANVIRQDEEINEEYDAITRKLIGHMLEFPRSISAGVDFIFIAKSIERIGDHAKNISGSVIFMEKGIDVRRDALEEMERKTS